MKSLPISELEISVRLFNILNSVLRSHYPAKPYNRPFTIGELEGVSELRFKLKNKWMSGPKGISELERLSENYGFKIN